MLGVELLATTQLLYQCTPQPWVSSILQPGDHRGGIGDQQAVMFAQLGQRVAQQRLKHHPQMPLNKLWSFTVRGPPRRTKLLARLP